MSVDVLSPNGNCILSILHSIGADKTQHAEFSSQIFAHFEKEEVAKALREIYEESGFDLCLVHREEESKVHGRACGVVIHAVASLIGVDNLVHWEAEDGVLEWMLGLASFQKRTLSSYQVALR